MTAVPPATPVTSPNGSTVAMVVVPLLQVPPAVSSAKVVILPTQTDAAPVIAEGEPLTVTVVVAGVPQPLL